MLYISVLNEVAFFSAIWSVPTKRGAEDGCRKTRNNFVVACRLSENCLFIIHQTIIAPISLGIVVSHKSANNKLLIIRFLLSRVKGYVSSLRSVGNIRRKAFLLGFRTKTRYLDLLILPSTSLNLFIHNSISMITRTDTLETSNAQGLRKSSRANHRNWKSYLWLPMQRERFRVVEER